MALSLFSIARPDQRHCREVGTGEARYVARRRTNPNGIRLSGQSSEKCTKPDIAAQGRCHRRTFFFLAYWTCRGYRSYS